MITKTKRFIYTGMLLSSVFFTACENAEAVKGYKYATTKENLETAVNKVIANNPNIYHESIKVDIDSLLKKAEAEATSVDSAKFYNDGKNYVTIKIKSGDTEND